MEKLSAFFHRIRANEDERQMVFRTLILRSYLVRAWDTAEDGLLTSNDAGGEWFDADSDTPPEEPLRAIVVRQSDGEATDSPYSLLVRVMGHFRKVANGLCAPDWDGLVSQAYITKDFAQEWEDAAEKIHSAPTDIASATAAPTADAQVTTHKLRTRTNILDSVINLATQTAIDATSHQSVWAALQALAESDSRPAPLLGFVETEGIKYQDCDAVKFFTKKNLRDRMARRATTR